MRSADDPRTSFVIADIMLCRGRFFGLEFDKPPSMLGKTGKVAQIDVLLDVMKPCVDDAVAAEDREPLLAAIDATLPAEYFSLVQPGKSVDLHGWHIFDVPQGLLGSSLDMVYWGQV